jgi:transcriptional regulator with XRE-family HTH domain
MLSPPEIDVMLAKRLRRERESRTWTLIDLAARSGVSRAMISKIERGEASPTAALLGRLSAAFELTLSQLFAPPDNQPTGRPESGITRVEEQPLWQDPETGFLRRSLSPPGPGLLELVWGELPPETEINYPAASLAFIADQQLVVIGGELSIVLGPTVHALGPGDCLRFGRAEAVTFRNSGVARCRYVIAVLRAGEHASPRRADGAGD